jgi:hypothetical protein
MGRGLFEPTDDLRASNPPSHPQLLAELVADFRSRQGGLRPLVRQIVLSDAYQRQTVTSGDPAAQRYYAQATARALEPEVLADAIADVTGVNDRYGVLPLGTRSITLLGPQQPTPLLDVLGRCEADRSCEPGEESAGGLAVMLHWMNGPLINRKLADPQGRLQCLIADGQSDQQIMETFYRLALSRNPTAGEREYWNAALSGDDEGSLRHERLEDFVWSLLSCREFTSNH